MIPIPPVPRLRRVCRPFPSSRNTPKKVVFALRTRWRKPQSHSRRVVISYPGRIWPKTKSGRTGIPGTIWNGSKRISKNWEDGTASNLRIIVTIKICDGMIRSGVRSYYIPNMVGYTSIVWTSRPKRSYKHNRTAVLVPVPPSTTPTNSLVTKLPQPMRSWRK